jgi:hypothetical protein
MRRFIVVATLVFVLLSVSLTLWAQGNSFTPSPHIYKIAAANCETGPAERVQSGFRVQNGVGIITALHGVLGCKTIIAEPGGDGQAFHNLIIGKVDIRHDVAVLWSKELAGAPLIGLAAITETLTIDIEETYQVIGYPFGLFRQKPTIDVKILEQTALGNLLPDEAINAIAERDSPAIDAEVLSVQTHLVPGHSGAPILNQQGQVVGIGNGGLDLGRVEMGWAIPWDGIDLKVVSNQVSQTVSWTDYRKLTVVLLNDSGLLFAYSMPEAVTSTLTTDSTSTATASSTVIQSAPIHLLLATPLICYLPTSVASTEFVEISPSIFTPHFKATIDLRVLDEGLTDNTYLIEGNSHKQFNIGDDLVVYAEPNPGTEIAIALMKVIGQSPNSLTAQALLIDPENAIRTRMRVDDQITFLAQSRLVPVFAYADGYLLRPTRIRLRLDHELTVGAQLQALEFERINGAIIDALRTDTLMQITDIGENNVVAMVDLITGTWPMTGTIVALVEATAPLPTPTATMTPTPQPTTTATPAPAPTYPCEAEVKSDRSGDTLSNVIRSEPGGNHTVPKSLIPGQTIYIHDIRDTNGIWYLISVEKDGYQWGWLPQRLVHPSSICPK